MRAAEPAIGRATVLIENRINKFLVCKFLVNKRPLILPIIQKNANEHLFERFDDRKFQSLCNKLVVAVDFR